MRFSLPDARAARPDQFFGAADMRLLPNSNSRVFTQSMRFSDFPDAAPIKRKAKF
jgi:hypothetical protein